MFGTTRENRNYLFCKGDLRATLEAQIRDLRNEVESLDQNQLLNTAPDALTNYFIDKYRVEPVALKPKENWTSDEQETQIDVRNDPHRMVRDRSRPAFVPGQRIEVFIPFDGDPAVPQLSPAQFSSVQPQGSVRDSEIVLTFEFAQNQ